MAKPVFRLLLTGFSNGYVLRMEFGPLCEKDASLIPAFECRGKTIRATSSQASLSSFSCFSTASSSQRPSACKQNMKAARRSRLQENQGLGILKRMLHHSPPPSPPLLLIIIIIIIIIITPNKLWMGLGELVVVLCAVVADVNPQEAGLETPILLHILAFLLNSKCLLRLLIISARHGSTTEAAIQRPAVLRIAC